VAVTSTFPTPDATGGAGPELPSVPAPVSSKVRNSNLGFSLGFMGAAGMRWLSEGGAVHARDWTWFGVRGGCGWKLEYGYGAEGEVVEGRLEYEEGNGEVGEEGRGGDVELAEVGEVDKAGVEAGAEKGTGRGGKGKDGRKGVA